MRRCSLILCLVMATVLTAAFAQPQRGTPEEAKAMALRAAELVRSIGEPALTEFNQPGGKWHDRDLYVFVYDQHGTVLAGDPSILGQNRKNVPYVQQMLNIADEGWVDYEFKDPITHREQPKRSYIVRVGDYVIGVGTYKPQ